MTVKGDTDFDMYQSNAPNTIGYIMPSIEKNLTTNGKPLFLDLAIRLEKYIQSELRVGYKKLIKYRLQIYKCTLCTKTILNSQYLIYL